MRGQLAFKLVLDRLLESEIDKVRQHADIETRRRELSEMQADVERSRRQLRDLEARVEEVGRQDLCELLKQLRQFVPAVDNALAMRIDGAIEALDPVPF